MQDAGKSAVRTDGWKIQIGGIAIRFVVDGPEEGASLSMFAMEVGPKTGMPLPHSHDAFDETMYGMSGRLAVTVDGKTVDVGAAQAVLIPRGAVHSFVNPHEEPAQALCVITPGVFGSGYFGEMGEVLRASAGGPPDLAKVGAVMRRHGLTPA
jgi:mannose-6-phosphate isomerase-like protein (cupin superfamily)